ncbi:MAG: TrkH family potassium uptake protein [bacterium]
MHLFVVQRVLGVLLMVFSFTLLPPVLVSYIYDEGKAAPFLLAFLISLLLGLISWLPARNYQVELRIRDGFVVVAMFWIVLSSVGALPFLLSENPSMSVAEAFFESVSGLTTTGATVLVGLDELPRAILYYRQQLQWLGGMGIIVLAVAVLPMLGIGGMQLYRAEAPGPVKDSKLTPRLAQTAKALWFLYLGLTIACGLGYWLAGMDAFDAIAHAYSTVAIGGFSTHDGSIGHFNSTAINLVAVLFMFLSGVNFALHFGVVQSRNPLVYLSDPEFRLYLTLILGVSSITIFGVWVSDTYIFFSDAFVNGLFQAVSIGTTTGFTTGEFYYWPGYIAILLLFASFVGGCAGSTGGGIKVIRLLLLIKQGVREITRLIHPNAQIPVRVGKRVVSPRIIEAVWGFFALYVACFTLMYLLLAATGIDLLTAFSAVAATINNLGPGLGAVGENYADIHDAGKWVLCVAMLLGRLEIFTLLVLISPAFWRR